MVQEQLTALSNRYKISESDLKELINFILDEVSSKTKLTIVQPPRGHGNDKVIFVDVIDKSRISALKYSDI